jgi:outer membrane biosynthesis protein TonB
MRFGLVISILLHAAVLALAVITFTRSMPPLDIPQQVPVDVVTMADKVNVKAQTKEAEKLPEKPPAPKPEPMPPPAPPPEPAPPSVPEPKFTVAEPAPSAKPKDKKPEKVAEVEPQARPTPPKPPEKKKEKFSLDSIAVLLDKSKKSEAKQEKTAAPSPDKTASEAAHKAQGAGTANTIDLVTSMQRQVERCWSFPAGAVQPEKLDVYVFINLKPDGTLSGAPIIENSARMSEPYFRAAAEAAVRALYQCQPFDLPKDQYDDWKEIRLNFDPRRMIGL